MRKKQLIFIAMTLLVFSGIFTYQNTNVTAKGSVTIDATSSRNSEKIFTTTYTDHDPISITSDSEFNSTNGVVSGNGTESNPYIIEGWRIESPDAIVISQTTAHFVIRDCLLIGNYSTSGINQKGLYLDYVADGTATIELVSASDYYYGFYIFDSDNVMIEECYSSDNFYAGIALIAAHYAIVHESILFNNDLYFGIYCHSSSNVIISHSYFELNRKGIYFSSSSHGQITFCDFVDNYDAGITASTSDNLDVTNCVLNDDILLYGEKTYMETISFVNTTINGEEVQLIYGVSFTTLTQTVGHLILVDCLSVTITNNYDDSFNASSIKLYHSTSIYVEDSLYYNNLNGGVRIWESTYIRVKNVISRDNYWQGIGLFMTNNSFIENCYLYGNYYRGIYLEQSHQNSIKHNHIKNTQLFAMKLISHSCTNEIVENTFDNGAWGLKIYMSSDHNIIHHNIFLVDQYSHTAVDESTNNTWYDVTEQTGNYWSDYSGTTNYTIEGSANSTDIYPVAHGDQDGDGIDDFIEIITYNTDPTRKDTDDDGLDDNIEIYNTKTDPNNPDTDDDGLLDGDEVLIYHTDPNNPDTDDDGLLDGDEVLIYHTDPNNPDTDDDGLLDGDEVLIYHTDPNNPDTDGDGYTDGEEVDAGTDPLDPNDYPEEITPTTTDNNETDSSIIETGTNGNDSNTIDIDFSAYSAVLSVSIMGFLMILVKRRIRR